VRIAIRVRPGASRAAVGGRYGDGHDAPLVVAVTARAVDGAATDAAVRAVAGALGIPAYAVRLVTGARSRTKILEIDEERLGGATGAQRALQALLER
jgi:hypothetical protein